MSEVNCGSYAHAKPDGDCECDEGFVWDHSGQCRQCGPNAYFNSDDECVCVEGYAIGASGECVRSPGYCNMNEVDAPGKGCMCIPGAHRGFGTYCWPDDGVAEAEAIADYKRRTGRNADGTKPFDIFDPGTWFSTMTATGELGPPVFVPEGQTPPPNGVIVSPPALERPFGGEAPAPGPRPLPGQGEPESASAEGTTPTGEAVEKKTSPWVWIGGAAVLGIAGWMLFGKSEKAR